jgi:hypothetical protein
LVQQYFPADIPGHAGNFGASVVNRMMMLNQTDGIAVGDFVIRPVVSENTGYNSNVLGVSESGSAEAETSASVRVNSNWARDAIGPSVSVEIATYRPISVLGEVNHPGEYPYQPGMTMLTAVALAGGFTYRAITGYASDVRHEGQRMVMR